MEHNTGERTAVTSSFRGCDSAPHSFSSEAGGQPPVSTPRPSHEQYQLPSEAPFTAEIANVPDSASKADIKQAFSSLPIKEVRSPSNIPGTFFVEFLDVQGLKQCLDEYWMFKIHDRSIRTYVASAPQSSVKPLIAGTFSSKPNAEPIPLDLLPLTSSFQSPSRCLHSQQSLLILINVHLLRSLCKSALELNRYYRSSLLNLKNTLVTFFKKVGYVSHHFFESALFASKVFFQTNTFQVIPEELPQLCSFASFFGADIQSVFLHVKGNFNVEEHLPYSNVISGLELGLQCHNDLEFLNKSSLFFPRLKQLHVNVLSPFAMIFAELLKENATVTSVDLRNNSIGAEGARALADALKVNTTVTSLDLRNNSIRAEGARALADVLKVNTVVTSINMRSNLIRDEGARALADALKVNPKYLIIQLQANSIGDVGARALADTYNSIGNDGAKALADVLKVTVTLTGVNLCYNSIGDEGVRALADALKVNTTVTSVNLSANYLEPEGARALADALKVNTTITSINLSSNRIKAEGARALADALIVNTTITSVNMGDNIIGVKGARALAEALTVNTTVTTVNLSANYLESEGARALAEALKVNTTITSIDLSKNSIGNEGAGALAEASKVNDTVEVNGVYLLGGYIDFLDNCRY
ncbi:hypothetical protein GEMRC1_009575 [Eukaryota sp. GEM-RC1]